MTDKVSDAKQQVGATARDVCIHIAKEMADLVKHTLGPSGLDNMLVDPAKESVITNDGATIVKESAIDHPVAKVIMEVARAQEEKCYDGTTSSIILTGELMQQASLLLKQKIHPTKISLGYHMAAIKAEEALLDMGLPANDEMLNKIAQTAMTGKSAETDKEYLASICVEVAKATDLDNVTIVARPNGKISKSVAISGILVDREKCHHNMPTSVEKAKIALLSVDISLPEFAKSVQVQVHNNDAVQDFIKSRNEQLQSIGETVLATGANVIFCRRDIDSFIQEHFAKLGIYAARRVRQSDLEAISKATGARLVSNIDNMTAEDLGTAELVEEISVGDRPLIKVTGAPTQGAVSILIRAPTQHVVDEINRAFDDAIGVVSIAIEDDSVLPGGGAPYMQVASSLKEYASTIGGREQMAVEAFANALEVIPMTIAENSGLDPLDSIIALRQAHSAKDGWKHGVDVNNGGTLDMIAANVLEPKRVIATAIRSATDTSSQLIRIEKILTAKTQSEFGDDDFNY